MSFPDARDVPADTTSTERLAASGLDYRVVEALHQPQILRVVANGFDHFRVGTEIRALFVGEAAVVYLHDPLGRALELGQPHLAGQCRDHLHTRGTIADDAKGALGQGEFRGPT